MAGKRTQAVVAATALLLSVAGASTALVACVEVPDNIRTHFADPRAGEPNNFRKGPHGSARPIETGEEPAAPAPKASEPALDAGAPPAAFDGGVS